MYAEAVGHYGLKPEYFFERLGLQEASDFVEGARLRERDPWERVRLLANVVCKCQTGDDLGLTFPWEMPSDEEIKATTADAMAAAKLMEQMVAAGKLRLDRKNE